MSIEQVLGSSKMSVCERIEIAVNMLNNKQQRIFACRCALSVMRGHDFPELEKAISVSLDFANGKATAEELEIEKWKIYKIAEQLENDCLFKKASIAWAVKNACENSNEGFAHHAIRTAQCSMYFYDIDLHGYGQILMMKKIAREF